MAPIRVSFLGLFLSLCTAVLAPAQAQDLTIGVRNGVVQSTVQGDLFYRSLQFEGGEVRTSLQTGLQVTDFWAFR